MAELIAQGSRSQQIRRRLLRVGQTFVLGRQAEGWSLPWDDHLSRSHAEVCFQEGRLSVKRLPGARNPIFLAGDARDQFELQPGEHFVIGETTFTLVGDRVHDPQEAQPTEQLTFSPQSLKQLRFRNPDYRLEVLSRLPKLISSSSDEAELFEGLVNMLLSGIRRASTAALVKLHTTDGKRRVEALHWDRRRNLGDDFHPSQRLICEAVDRGQSVLHVWGGKSETTAQTFTMAENVDWAFCTPVAGEACSAWALYLAGHTASEDFLTSRPPRDDDDDRGRDLREDVKFAELVAATLSSVRQVKMLERRQASLSQFFAPAVLKALATGDPDEVLAPRETELSVLFCDLRGFSLKSEHHADNLLGLLNRVSGALGVMTHHILAQGGVFGDFQGDAAMGFWGWPLAGQDEIKRACLAALAISRDFEAAGRQPSHPLSDFRVGIGLTTGRAVAGRIGTTDQVKVTVFGPLVNRASRLEGMTKILQTPILMDESTAKFVREQVPRTVARSRRIAKVRPYGMTTPIMVSELLPPAADYPDLTDEHLEQYDRALNEFLAGHWSEAIELLHYLPAKDRVKDFLTVYIVEHDRTPPPGWDGIIQLLTKG
jgi:adenylate cyclase